MMEPLLEISASRGERKARKYKIERQNKEQSPSLYSRKDWVSPVTQICILSLLVYTACISILGSFPFLVILRLRQISKDQLCQYLDPIQTHPNKNTLSLPSLQGGAERHSDPLACLNPSLSCVTDLLFCLSRIWVVTPYKIPSAYYTVF